MNENRSIEGKWWVYGPDKEPAYGVLDYEPEGGLQLSVKVPGVYTMHQVFAMNAVPNPTDAATLFGEDKDCHPVTLYGCHPPGTSSTLGLRTITYRPMRAILGRRFASWSETKVNHIHAEFTLLHNWMGRSRLALNNGLSDTPQVAVSPSERFEVTLPRGAALVLWPTLECQKDRNGVQLSEGHEIEFRFSEPEPIDRASRDYVDVFRRLLTFFAGEPVFTDKIYFEPDDGLLPRRVTLLSRNTGLTQATRDLSHHSMLVSFADIQERVAQVFQNWYALEERLRDTLNLYFATIFNRSLYTNQQFLLLAQALEVYHRNNPRFEGCIEPKQDFKARKKRVLEAVPDQAEWLKEKLAHANEKSLAERLKDLLDAHSQILPKFIQDPDGFAETVRHTRNHFTHYSTNPEKRSKVATGTALLEVIDQMHALLEICIFSELGIEGTPIERLLVMLREREYFSL